MARIKWNQVKMSDIQQNILTGGKEWTSADDPKIEANEVKKSLGQASVGQALLCTVKREGLEAQECVVNILRPNAAGRECRDRAVGFAISRLRRLP